MTHLLRIAERVINRPLLLHPQKAEVILWVLGERIGTAAPKPDPEANRFIGQPRLLGRSLAYNVTDGAAVITVEGTLVNRGDWIGADSGLVSYEGLEAQVMLALNDANVRSIVLDLDSPGGEATGMYAIAEKIRAARQTKPIVALVNDMAASAAYGIASQANRIVVSPTSVVGSIGVVLLHLDRSKQYEFAGVAPTLIFAGAHKVDGNAFEPLSAEVKADLQAEVQTFYDRFVEIVALGRGARLTEKQARQTEARTYIGAAGIEEGLADHLGTLSDAIALANALTRDGNAAGPAGRRNATREPGPAAGGEPVMEFKDITAESLRQNRPDLVAALQGDVASQIAEARAAAAAEAKAASEAEKKTAGETAAKAERERIEGIRAAAFEGQDELVKACIADGSAIGEAARKLNADYKAKGKHLADIKNGEKHVAGLGSAPNAGGGGQDGGQPVAKTPDEWKAEFAASAQLQQEYGSAETYVAFKKNESKVRVLHGRQAAA